MSQDSVDTLELNREIEDSILAHQNLYDFSTSSEPLILPKEMANIPLPSQTVEEIHSLNWSEEEMFVLEEHRLYHEKMLLMINHAKTSGPVTKIPSPPKRKLKDLFNEKMNKKKKTEKMTVETLHDYLKQHVQDMNKAVSRKPFLFASSSNLNEAVDSLKKAHEHLLRQEAQTMMMHILFGDFLNNLFVWHAQQKQSGNLKVTWDKWLSYHIPISSSHARRIRRLAELLIPFPLFQSLGLSLTEVMSKFQLIKEMLSISEYAQYWKKGQTIPTLASVSSQEN